MAHADLCVANDLVGLGSADMTLLEIEILVHYHTRLGDYREGDFSAPAVLAAINRFRDTESLLRYATEKEKSLDYTDRAATYAITERGRLFVEVIQSIPLPVATWTWIMPSPWPQMHKQTPVVTQDGTGSAP